MSDFINSLSDRVMYWVGSTGSIVFHTLVFTFVLLSHWLFGWDFNLVLLTLTTVVSLEAIYLAIFIQRSVNQQAVRLDNVEEGLDEVEESLEGVEESLEDVEEGLDEVEKALDDAEGDIASIPKNTAKKMEKSLDELLEDIRRLVAEHEHTPVKTEKQTKPKVVK